ncbi:hypothetical protein MBLNU230_g3500t1 [Neophaeotheca triangularis]
MPSYGNYTSPTSPPHNRLRDHSPTKSSPLRHTLSTVSHHSNAENSSIPSRQGNFSSNASSGYSGSGLSGYDSTSDPFLNRPSSKEGSALNTSAKRERSESPVKKNAAFAKWEQREQAEQEQVAPKMNVTPKKVRDDEWRSGIGRTESRNALRPVEQNSLPTVRPTKHARSQTADLGSFDIPPPSDRSASPPMKPAHHRGYSQDAMRSEDLTPMTSPPSLAAKNSLATLSRSDSMRGGTKQRTNEHARFGSTDNTSPQLDEEELATLQKSSTPHLRHLSKMAVDGGAEDMTVHSREEQVVGLAGRRRLQRSGSTRPSANKQSQFSSQYASTRWMDTQRKHLQAYEYLCHIGEARAWLEDVLDPAKLPPIVELEEALRDGVTLAETVVQLAPNLPVEDQRSLGSLRIFRSPRLQYRHSDNIALFFRFLGSIELPELFRFELVDLYEKKNIPKVIYCIHALSWLLFRKGIVDFRIGNLVGQLTFEDHELEATQKGIEKSGVQMPNFGGMREALQVEEEPPPPEPTPEEILAEQHEVIVDLQSQAKGALTRLRLGNVMQDLWDVEHDIAAFQALARGGFAREIFKFRNSMDQSTRLFQAGAKAFLVRTQLHRKQRGWRENKQAVVTMQSLWRGRQQRAETQQIRRQMQSHRHGLKELQSAIRGALGRWRAGDIWHETQEAGAEAEAFQAAARGVLERMKISGIMNALWDVEENVCFLQASIRGGFVRRQARSQKAAARQSAVDVVRLQAVARGLIQRRDQKTKHGQFHIASPAVVDVQAAARGLVTRLRQARTMDALRERVAPVVKLQALLRANKARHGVKTEKAQLLIHEHSVAMLQALARGVDRRQKTVQLRKELAKHGDKAVDLQGISRAMLERKRIGIQLAALEDQESSVEKLQSLARSYLERQRVFEQLVAMEKEEDSVSQLQAFARAMLLRSNIGTVLAELEEHEGAVVDLQSACRAYLIRRNFAEKKRHYRENMQKVIKLQSFVRGKQQGESYKSLVNGKNPPLPVVRRHLHLLTDSNLEFEGELEAERLRRQVVESVRRNELVQGYVDGMETKIGLLVKQRITVDEIVKHQKHFGGSASQLLRSGSTLQGGGFDLKALNKSSRKKLTGYEELFFLLQTQPDYLGRLFNHLSNRGLPEKESKDMERRTMTLFGYAQKNREEYLLLRVLAASVQETVSQSNGLDEYMRLQNSSFHQRLFLSYIRSPRDRAYFKIAMGKMVKAGIVAQEHLDLESDPLQIYRAILNNEELSTGRTSSRPRDLPRETVIREPDVRPAYVEHLQDLRDLCDGFFLSLEETLHRMPYGLRYLAAETYHALCQQFPQEDSVHLTMLVGSWLWKSYLLPALREPEMWAVVDHGLSAPQRRNLGQVVTVLSQVAAGRLFGADNLYLQPLNSWVTESLGRWREILQHLVNIESPEEHFDADQWSDLYSRTKPTLYIKMVDIFALHSLLTENLQAIAPLRDDPLKELLTDLGTAKSNETDLGHAGSGSGEITLTLKSRFTVQEDPNADVRALFTATKRLVLYIIRVQSGSNLMEILLRPISQEDDDCWTSLIEAEVMEKERNSNPRRNQPFDPRASLRGARAQSVYSEAPSTFSEDRKDLVDLEGTSYAELKSSALENILALENASTPPQFRVSRHNNYQEILNAIAGDIRQKHRRRLERLREIETTRDTLAALDAKAEYLEGQLRDFNEYIESSLHTLATKKNNKSHKFIMPFTKQWSHEQELKRSGRSPKFGSYKYSARQLHEKGVLVSWPQFAVEHWNQVNIVISSDEVGVFHLEASSGSMMLPGASANLLLDDLLQAQYDNRQGITVFEQGEGGAEKGARLAVNLLLHLVFKKFYRDT